MQVDYHSSGQFGDAICSQEDCKGLLLKSEFKKCKRGKQTQCCSNGEVLTEETMKHLEELQNPPEELNNLVRAKEKKSEAFLNNTKPLNNTYSFASVHSKRAPVEQLGGRNDTIKVNGKNAYQKLINIHI